MSDWQVGDLALCIDNAPSPGTLPGVEHRLCLGRVYRVIGIGITRRRGARTLFCEGVVYPLGIGNKASRFRKIRPDSHEGNVADWNLILETAKRRVRA